MNEDTIVCLNKINKSFSTVQVLFDVDLELKKGEVHAIVGENGAGKSTLMKILMGVYPPDSGEIIIDDIKMKKYNVNVARDNGIVIIPQELSLVPAYTVAENIFLSQRGTAKFGFVSGRKMISQADALIKELGYKIDAGIRTDKLPIAYRQVVSIVKAVAENAKVIIMDEPTSSISKDEVDELMKIIDMLKKRGTTIIYISHLLDEVFSVSDRVTVLRDGKLVTTLDKKSTTQREVISFMVGEDLLKTQQEVMEKTKKESKDYKNEEPIFEISNLRRKEKEEEVSLRLHKGEVIGITGLVGSGKTELVRTIIGLDKKSGGQIFIEGKGVNLTSPKSAYKKGIAIVPEDRKLQGLVLIRSVIENIALSDVYRKRISRAGFINQKKEKKDALNYVNKLKIRITSLRQTVDNLSGGNQQKVAVSKALMVQPKILILDEPTRGIDVGAKAMIYKLIMELKEQGMGILFFSSDISEIPFISDRVLVMREGKIVAKLNTEQATIENMLNYMAGGESV
ncbi:MAG: sugar ABC transporter ATP-binding protein [Eubacteriales bacterium]|nr:sugar ABC transporter ATP-binding protein [Eubacteriales bacterium]